MSLPLGEDIRSVQRRYLWFGNMVHQQWVPMPSSGISASRVGTTHGEMNLSNGGYAVVNSTGYHREFEFNFGVREARSANGLDIFSKFRSGYFNDFAALSSPSKKMDKNLIHFVDPFAAQINALPPHWATPALCLPRNSWHPIGKLTQAAQTTANTRGFSPYSVTLSVDHAANQLPSDERRQTTVLLIPPTHKLRLGWNGVATGAGRLIINAMRRDTGLIDTTNLGPLAVDSVNGLAGTGFNGDEYAWVQIGFGRTSTATSTVTVAGMMAQILPDWVATDTTTGGVHAEGLGHTGLQFADDAIVESYELVAENRVMKGLSTRLAEVGAWR